MEVEIAFAAFSLKLSMIRFPGEFLVVSFQRELYFPSEIKCLINYIYPI
jgi:hypothetical protein